MNILSEIKTLAYMRSTWVCIFLLLAITLFLEYNSYNFCTQKINQTKEINQNILLDKSDNSEAMKEVKQNNENISKITQGFNPENTINNSFVYMNTIGTIIVSIVSILFIGIEYNKKTILTKICTTSLQKLVFRKICVMQIAIVTILFLYFIVHNISGRVFFSLISKQVNDSVDSSIIINNNIEIVLLSYVRLSFYSMLFMLITCIFKGVAAGVITLTSISFLSSYLQLEYLPYNIFNSFISKFYHTNAVNTFSLTTSVDSSITFSGGICIIILYFVIILSAFRIVTKYQTN